MVFAPNHLANSRRGGLKVHKNQQDDAFIASSSLFLFNFSFVSRRFFFSFFGKLVTQLTIHALCASIDFKFLYKIIDERWKKMINKWNRLQKLCNSLNKNLCLSSSPDEQSEIEPNIIKSGVRVWSSCESLHNHHYLNAVIHCHHFSVVFYGKKTNC